MTNEDDVGALVEFTSGAQGSFEGCRVIQGGLCEMAFEVHGTRGAARWNFERMNELQLYLTGESPNSNAYTTLVSGPSMPFHANFNPGPAVGLGYDDLKVIEAHEFLRSIATGRQGEPGFAEALAVAQVQRAVERGHHGPKPLQDRPVQRARRRAFEDVLEDARVAGALVPQRRRHGGRIGDGDPRRGDLKEVCRSGDRQRAPGRCDECQPVRQQIDRTWIGNPTGSDNPLHLESVSANEQVHRRTIDDLSSQDTGCGEVELDQRSSRPAVGGRERLHDRR